MTNMKKLLSSLTLLAMSLVAMAQDNDNSRWMSNLDDDAFVCQLSIPGAHDACASSFSGILSPIYKSLAQTQSKSVQDMLPSGVRAFDLRPCVSGNKLHINHGAATTSYDFDPIMQQLCSFVDANPTEFCIVIIRHETEGDGNSSKFGDLLQNSLSGVKDHLIDFRPNLTVGEARGKILVLSRDAYTAPVYGGRIVDLRDNRSDINEMLGGHCYGNGTYKCAWWVQDCYEFSDIGVKKQAILNMLSRSSALERSYGYTWAVNHTSGYKGSASASAYQDNAKTCNIYMQQLLASGKYNGPAGLVLMDYAADGDDSGYCGLSLTKTIINHNFKYTMSNRGDSIRDGNGGLFVAPKGSDMMWEGKFYRKEGTDMTGPSGWYKTDFDDSGWETKRFPIASEGTDAPYYSRWDGTNNVIFIRREFYIDHDAAIDTFRLYARHDDDYKVYLNGSQIDSENGWIGNYRTVSIQSSKLNVGRNVLAIQVKQISGGAYFDCGISCVDGTSATVKITSGGWNIFIAPGHDFDFTDSGIKAYKVTEIVCDSLLPYARIEEADIVPSGQAVLVSSEKGMGTFRVPVAKTTARMEDNILKAAATSFKAVGENAIYCLANQDTISYFSPVADGTTVAKNRGYLDLNGMGVTAERIYISQDGSDLPNAITTIARGTDGADYIYNVSGQRMKAQGQYPHGIYIINGKKMLR